MLTEYRNEPFTDFSIADNQKAFTQALDVVKKKLGKDHPLVVGGERLPVEGDDWLVSNKSVASETSHRSLRESHAATS